MTKTGKGICKNITINKILSNLLSSKLVHVSQLYKSQLLLDIRH